MCKRKSSSRSLQAQKLMEVLELKGPQHLETYCLPRLTWQEYKTLKSESPALIEGGVTDMLALPA